jgi:hypothetical protein
VVAPDGFTEPFSVAAAPAMPLAAPSVTCGVVTGGESRSSAFLTSSRPPVVTLPASAGTGSTPASSACLTCTGVADGTFENRSAAAPETCGVAMDVPFAFCSPPFHQLKMPTPGAARSTVAAP